MATETVKTYQLKRDGIEICTGSVKVCAEFAAQTAYRRNNLIPEKDLDGFERTLRKERTASLYGHAYTIELITEEYESDEEN